MSNRRFHVLKEINSEIHRTAQSQYKDLSGTSKTAVPVMGTNVSISTWRWDTLECPGVDWFRGWCLNGCRSDGVSIRQADQRYNYSFFVLFVFVFKIFLVTRVNYVLFYTRLRLSWSLYKQSCISQSVYKQCVACHRVYVNYVNFYINTGSQSVYKWGILESLYKFVWVCCIVHIISPVLQEFI